MGADTILKEILARGEGFGHRQHLELTWRTLEEHEPDTALALIAEAIRHLAAAHGAPDKYHATITSAWVHCVAVHRERSPAPDFDAFIARNPQLLNQRLLDEHFSPELLAAHGPPCPAEERLRNVSRVGGCARTGPPPTRSRRRPPQPQRRGRE